MPPQAEIQALTSGNSQKLAVALFSADQIKAYDAFEAAISGYPAGPSPSSATIAAQARAVTGWWDGADAAAREITGISVPTLIADGTADRLDPVANDHALANLIPRSKLVLYPDAGHAFLFQVGARFTTLLESFPTAPPGR